MCNFLSQTVVCLTLVIYTHIEPSQAHGIRQVCLTTLEISLIEEAVIAKKKRCVNGFEMFSETKNFTCMHSQTFYFIVFTVFRCLQLGGADRSFSISYTLSDNMLPESIIIMTLLFQ